MTQRHYSKNKIIFLILEAATIRWFHNTKFQWKPIFLTTKTTAIMTKIILFKFPCFYIPKNWLKRAPNYKVGGQCGRVPFHHIFQCTVLWTSSGGKLLWNKKWKLENLNSGTGINLMSLQLQKAKTRPTETNSTHFFSWYLLSKFWNNFSVTSII